LEAGKAVLCEKPFTVNAPLASEVISFATRKHLLIMEAMWTRFFPATKAMLELLAEGVIGKPEIVTADFGFRSAFDSRSRLFNPRLGGGALLDVGVYPLTFASLVLGRLHNTASNQKASFPSAITSLGLIGKTKVDEQTAITLRYEGGEMAVLHTSIRAETPGEAVIIGAKGRIRVHAPFWKPSKLSVSVEGRKDQVLEFPYEGHGYHFEIAEFQRCLRAGLSESPGMPLDETILILRIADTVRAQIGVRYPLD
jgi:predicted dehydrogenase